MREALLYIHGDKGSAAEAEHYKPLLPEYDVIGLDYQGATPWEVQSELLSAYISIASRHSAVRVLANSIGAYFVMNGLSKLPLKQALFISPIVDMEKLISDMMARAGITEDELAQQGKLRTPTGEVLSWNYLSYVKTHPITWPVPTAVLYGRHDQLTALDTMETFAKKHQAVLTIMDEGEHWFHTPEQMAFVDKWLKDGLSARP